jgi:hypothetical protein
MKKLIFTLTITLLAGANIMAADYFWVGGSGNWSDYAIHWATTSGGATFHTQAPTENDNVYFDANSFSASDQVVTIDLDAYCADMDWTGATNEPELAGATSRKLYIYGSLTFIEAMDFSYAGEVYFESPATGKTITSAGQTFKRNVYFQGEGGYILQDGFEQTGTYIVYFIRGTLDFNNQDFTAPRFYAIDENVRSLSFGSSTITLTYSGSYALQIREGLLTFDAGTSLIRFTGATGYLHNRLGSGLIYHDVIFESLTGNSTLWAENGAFNKITFSSNGTLRGSITADSTSFSGTATIYDNNNINVVLSEGDATIIGTNNFGKITLNGKGEFRNDNTIGELFLSAGKSYTFYIGKVQTINDVITANGNCAEPISLQSNSTGNASTINKTGGSVTVNYCNMQDIHATGTASFTANNTIDLGNNTGWTINAPTPQTFHWIGGTGNWNDPDNWSLSSGGSSGDCIPSALDDVIFNANSFNGAGQVVTIIGDENNNAYCNNMDWTGVTNNPTIASATSVKLNIHGSLTMVNDMVWDFLGDVFFKGEDTAKSPYTLTSAGQTFKRDVYFLGTGNYELEDDFEISGSNRLNFDNGGLNLNDIILKAHQFWADTDNSRTLNLGSSTIELSYSGTGYTLDFDGSNLIFNAGTSLLKFTGSSPRMRNSATGLTFYNALFESATGTSRIVASSSAFNNVTINNSANLSGGNTINLLTINGDATIGTDNNIIITLVVGGTAIFNNNNGNYGHVTLNGNGNINGVDNTFGTLIFTAGNLYKFQSARTQFITDDFFANGTETEPIVIEASSSGSQATISKASGNNVVVEYVSLKDNKAIGVVSFTANNSLDMGNNEGWTINAPGGRDLYWVGGTGDWNDPANWAEASNGTGGAGIPSLLDNVFFDAFSFDASGQTVTVIGDATNDAYCMNMDWTGVTNNPTIASSTSVKLNIHGSLTMVNNMVWDFSGDLYFLGENASKTSYTITSAGQTFKRNVYFQGTGNYTLQDDLEISGSNILYFENGGLDLNNNDFTGYRFISDNSNTKSLNLTSSVITLSYSGTGYTLDIDGTNLTFNAGTSLLKFTGLSPRMLNSGAGLIFYNALFESETGTSRIVALSTTFNNVTINNDGILNGGCTVNTLTFNGNGTINTDGNTISTAYFSNDGVINSSNTFGTLEFTAGKTYTLTNGKTQTILTDFVAEGTCAQPVTIQSNSSTIQSTILKSSGTVTVTRAFIEGINAVGGAEFIAENSIDVNNNSGWEFIVIPENLYWVGGSGDWDDVNKWSNESGGTGGYCVPSRLDNVIFDANSFFQEAQFVQINSAEAECLDMDWSAADFSPTLLSSSSTNNLRVFGSLNLNPNMNFAFSGKVYFEGQVTAKSAYNIFTGGQSFNNHIYFNGLGGEWNLMDDFSAGSNNIYHEHGTLNTNDNSVSCGRFISTNSNTRALNMGASEFNLSSTSNEAWHLNSSNITLDAGSSEIIFTAAGGGLRSYGLTILAYHDVLFQNTGGTSILRSNHMFNNVVFNPVGTIRDGGAFGSVTMHRGGQLQNNSSYNGTVKLYGNTTITGTNNFTRLLLGAGNTFIFPSGQTQTISGRFIIWGSAANPITIQSSASGTLATVTKSGGTVLGNYIHLKDMEATGGATFDLYSSVDNGNNIGWNFLAGTYDELTGITISNLDEECYEATEIITVGGTDHFTVQDGGSATLIAGYKIELLPGTRVHNGGSLHAYITPYGFFCDTISTMLASDLVEEIAEEPFPALIKEGFFFNIFPNPTTGLFTLELYEFDEFNAIIIEISSMLGESIIRQEMPAAAQYRIDLSRYHPGIYLVRVIQGKEAGVLKVVKK